MSQRKAVTLARNEAASALQALGGGNVGGAELTKLAGAENALQGALGKLNVTMEAYPEITANENMQQLSNNVSWSAESPMVVPAGNT